MESDFGFVPTPTPKISGLPGSTSRIRELTRRAQSGEDLWGNDTLDRSLARHGDDRSGRLTDKSQSHQYAIWRNWPKDNWSRFDEPVLFLGYQPSATEWMRSIALAYRLGFAGCINVNLYTSHDEDIGPMNERVIADMAGRVAFACVHTGPVGDQHYLVRVVDFLSNDCRLLFTFGVDSDGFPVNIGRRVSVPARLPRMKNSETEDVDDYSGEAQHEDDESTIAVSV